MDDYPKEYFIELGGLSPYLVGRVSVFKLTSSYNVEIDIIQNESGKIFNHVKSLYNQSSEREAVDLSVHHLKQYLDSKAKLK